MLRKYFLVKVQKNQLCIIRMKKNEQEAIQELIRHCEIYINNFENIGMARTPYAPYNLPYSDRDTSQYKYRDIKLERGTNYEIVVEKIVHDVPEPLTFDDIKEL